MAKIEDFKKEYVSVVNFKNGDKIVVTDENFQPLKQALKRTNFHWISGSHVEKADFKPGIIITLNDDGCYYRLTECAYGHSLKQAINYVFVKY